MGIKIPELCIFCKNFPCIKDDEDATVVCELQGSYPFLDERDSMKPCEGKDFEPVDFSDSEEEKPVATSTPTKVPEPEPEPETEKFVYIVKEADEKLLQKRIDALVDNELVVDYKVAGVTSAYEPESSVMKLVVVIEVVQRIIDDGEGGDQSKGG